MFGLTYGLLDFTKFNASWKPIFFFSIKYAITIVADRDIPAMQ